MISDPDVRARERVGAVLNEKWSLESLIGIGGMAAVYAGRHRNGARAAIKLLHGDLSRQSEVRERFLREGYAANRVEHPGAVKVLDDDVVASGPDAGTAYLVMELLEGESLQERLERPPPVDEREFLQLADGILDVLVAAHAHGVVHRDLKPENLFLLPEREGVSLGARVKILDFGLARLVQGEAITSYGLALGTPSFMSPEQAAGRSDEIDGRTDLFALAATGFRLRAGRRIHEGANPVELVTKMANAPAPALHSVAPHASAPFARVIDRALAFRRDDRYEDAGAMQRDVRRALAELESDTAATWVCAPAIPPIAAGGPEPTVEVSRSDLEPTPDGVVRPRAGQAEESIRIPFRRPVLPLVLLLVVGVFAAKWLFDAHSESADASDAEVVSSTTATTAAAPPADFTKSASGRRNPPADASSPGHRAAPVRSSASSGASR